MTFRKAAAISALASVPLMMTLGNSMLIPILPELAKELGVNSLQISMIITVYSIIAIVLIPIAGYLSDRIGRKKVIIPALLLAAIGGLVSALAASIGDGSYWLVLLGRLFQGAGAAGAAPIIFPLTGDLFKNEEEVSSVLGLVETSNTFGKALSPILGSLIALMAWYMPFYFIPVFSLLSVILILIFIRLPKANAKQKREMPIPFAQFWDEIKKIFKIEGKWLSAVFVAGGTSMFTIFAVLFYLSEQLEDKHDYHGVAKGALLAIPLSALCLASYLTGKWIGERKKLMRWLSAIGMIVLTAAALVCAINLPGKLLFLFTVISAGVAGIGVCLPCMDSLITAGINKEQRGTVTSLYSSMRFIGVAVGPPVASLLMSKGASLMFYTVAAVSGITVVVILWLIKSNASKEITPKG